MANRLRVTCLGVAVAIGLTGLAACGSDSGADATTTTTGSTVATTSTSTVAANTSASTIPPTTASATTTSATAAPSTTSPPSQTTTQPAPSTAQLPSTTSGAPAPGPNVYLAFTATGEVTARSGDQLLGEAGCGECDVTAAAYRDGVMWIAAFSDVAEVTRHDLASGKVTSVYRADPGVQIEDITVWDSSVWIVLARDDPGDGPASSLIAVDSSGARQIEDSVVGVAASQDGRYLAYGACGPCRNQPRGDTKIAVADLISGKRRDIPATDITTGDATPSPLSWSSDGRLLLDHGFNKGHRSSILAFDATSLSDAVHLTKRSADPNAAAPAEAACFVDDAHVAVARWEYPAAGGVATPGPIVVRSLTTPDETPYGTASVIGTSMACDTAGAVVVTTDDGRLLRIAPDGTTTELGVGYLRVTAT